MMLRPSTIERGGKAASVKYLMATAYYIGADGKPASPSQWNGRLAEDMKIEGRPVTQKHLENVLDGFNPSGRKNLTHNAGKDSRKKLAYDCPMTVPKTVSVLYAQSSPEMREKIMAGLTRANGKAIVYLEDNVMVRTGARSAFSAHCDGLAVASFVHVENRGGEPHIHIHNAIAAMAATTDANGNRRIASLDESEIYQHFRTAGAVADCEMARELSALGITIEGADYGFRVADIPREVERALSKRGEEITDHAKKKGKNTKAGRDQAQADTKGAKKEQSPEELNAAWAEKAKTTGWGQADAAAVFGKPVKSEAEVAESLRANIGQTLDEMARKSGLFTKDEMMRAIALRAAAEGGLSSKNLLALTAELMTDGRIVSLGQNARTQGGGKGKHFTSGVDEVFTTARTLRTEVDIWKSYEAGKTDIRHHIKPEGVAAAMDSFEKMKSREKGAPVSLKGEQRDLMKYLATCGQQGIIVGDPGTGKTFSMEAAKGMMQSFGYTEIIGAALAATAAEGLAADAKLADSGSITSLLMRMEKGRIHDHPKLAIIIDEAAMADPFAVRAIQQYFTEAKIIYLGDPKQLQSIEGGGWMKGLVADHGGARLQDIVRQKEDWHKEAIQLIGDGKGDKALKIFEEKNVISFHDDSKELLGSCVKGYLADGAAYKDKSMIAATNLETSQLNRLAHDVLTADGKIGPSHSVFVAKKEDFVERQIGVGERIVITKNDKVLDIKNTDCGTVESIKPSPHSDGFLIKMRMDKNGKTVEIDSAAFAHIEQAYARTNHKLQGKTLNERAYVHIGAASQTLREFWYVAASRSKDITKFFCQADDKEDLAKSIIKSGAKGWTLDHMRPEEAEKIIAKIEKATGSKVEAIPARIIDRDYQAPMKTKATAPEAISSPTVQLEMTGRRGQGLGP